MLDHVNFAVVILVYQYCYWYTSIVTDTGTFFCTSIVDTIPENQYCVLPEPYTKTWQYWKASILLCTILDNFTSILHLFFIDFTCCLKRDDLSSVGSPVRILLPISLMSAYLLFEQRRFVIRKVDYLHRFVYKLVNLCLPAVWRETIYHLSGHLSASFSLLAG